VVVVVVVVVVVCIVGRIVSLLFVLVAAQLLRLH